MFKERSLITTELNLPQIINPKLSRLTRMKEFFQKNKYYLLSHHPDCPKFESHTFSVANKKFCIGCFIGYPAAILGIILGNIFVLNFITSPFLLSQIGFYCLFALFLSLTPLTKKKSIKIVQKFLFGFGSGFLIIAFWYSFVDPWYLKLLFEYLLILFINSPINSIHMISHRRMCKKCTENQCVDQNGGY